MFLVLARALGNFLYRNFSYVRRSTLRLRGKTDAETEAAIMADTDAGDLRVQRNSKLVNDLRLATKEYATSRRNLTADMYGYLISSRIDVPDACYMFRFVELSLPLVNVPAEPNFSCEDLVTLPDMDSLQKQLLAYNTELTAPTADQMAAKVAMMEGRDVERGDVGTLQ